MNRLLTHAGRWARLRAPLLALAVLAGACDRTDDLATTEPDVHATGATLDSAATDSLAPDSDSIALSDSLTTDGSLTPADLIEIEASEAAVLSGKVPYGPYGLWSGYTDLRVGAAPFTSSFSSSTASGIIKQINAARAKGHRLVLSLTGGPSTNYTTNGRFDYGKWKARLNTFNTPTIKAAVRAAVADGTLILNAMIDDADVTSRWGVMTKPMLDNMARYSKSIFPTLPVSVNVQYNYRSHERFYVVDAIFSQYRWWRTAGNIKAYRDKAMEFSRREGVKVMFGMNILDGGIPSPRGSWSCAYGRGTYAPNCRMSPTQVRDWGRALGPAGCGLLMWRYDQAFITKTANVSAFRDVGSLLRSVQAKSCRR